MNRFLLVCCLTFVSFVTAGMTQLEMAIRSLDLGRVEELATRNNVRVASTLREATALHSIARIPFCKYSTMEPADLKHILTGMTDKFMKLGVDPAAKDNLGLTALAVAIQESRYEVWEVFREKILEEIKEGVTNGPWTRVMDVGKNSSDTPLNQVWKSILYAPDRVRTADIGYELMRIQARRLGNNFIMNHKIAKDAMIELMGSWENVDQFTGEMHAAKVKNFETFFNMAWNFFKQFRQLQPPKFDPKYRIVTKESLDEYKEGKVYPFYLSIRDYFCRYKRLHILGMGKLGDKYDYDDKILDMSQSIRNDEVADFENRHLFAGREEFEAKLRQKFPDEMEKCVFPEEDVFITCIIEYIKSREAQV